MSLGEKHVLTAALSTLIVVGSAVWWGRAPRAPAAPHTENRQAGRTDAASTTLAPAPAASPSLKLPRRLPLQREQEEQRDELRRSIYAALNQPRPASGRQRSAPERPADAAGHNVPRLDREYGKSVVREELFPLAGSVTGVC
ncbi:MAG TPA: hypothetical protein VER33_26775 [Polyangiaceae bacterium]|nr:hypothetical protein [Polyangiaceae bacterium]